MSEFEIRMAEGSTLASGMHRDTTEGKTDYTLIRNGPMFERWAEHLTKGAALHGKRNWLKADSLADYERFVESAARHFEQWLQWQRDEDHAAGVFFNINGAEYVREIIDAQASS